MSNFIKVLGFSGLMIASLGSAADVPSKVSEINCKDLKDRKGPWSVLPKGQFHLDAPEWKEILASLPENNAALAREERVQLEQVLRCFEKSQDGRDLQQALKVRKDVFARPTEPEITAETGSMEWKAALDGAMYSSMKGSQNFFSERGSSVDLRLNAMELQEDVIRIVRSAEKVLSISYLEYYQDRFGLIFATELIARRAGKQMPDPDFFKRLWGITFADAGIVTTPQRLYKLTSWDSELPRLDWKVIRKNADQLIRDYGIDTKAKNGLQIKVFLDRLRVSTLGPLNPKSLIGILEKFGIPVAQIKNFHPNNVVRDLLAPFQMLLPLAGTNHVKITANESEVILSGGNIVDKVVFETDDVPTPLMKWHDAAVRLKGPVVTDIHRFFARHYNNAAGRGRPKVDLAKYLPQINGGPIEVDGYTRLVTTVNDNPMPIGNHGLNPSQTEISLEFAVKNAKESIYIENAFFSDVWVTSLLVKKAQQWGLTGLKEALKENPRQPTCGKDLAKVARKRIVVLIPANMDQPAVKMAEISLIPFLAQAGIDVCRWSGDLANQRLKRLVSASTVSQYLPRTMMHTKAWQVDERAAYVGSANMNRRSIRGDLELGVISTSRTFNTDVFEKLFRRDFADSEAPVLKPQDFLLLPAALFLNGLNAT